MKSERLAQVTGRIEAAARRCNRDPASIRLVAVSKQHPAPAIRMLATAGQRDFGESYAQEALPKIGALADLGLTWHFIGRLQGNKTRTVAEHFAWVHTLDRERMADRLSEQRPDAAPPLNVCIQVQLVPEPQKGGVPPGEVEVLARHVRALPRLQLRGLMCIPPAAESEAAQQALFAQLAECAARLRRSGIETDTLSMGMSDDFEAAIAAGSTLVRIGTALFGTRAAQTI
jgi:pyridoxal phosphate enzyme (YggS family)